MLAWNDSLTKRSTTLYYIYASKQIAYVRTGGGVVQVDAYALHTGVGGSTGVGFFCQNIYALRAGGGGWKICKFLRTYFMDGPLKVLH